MDELSPVSVFVAVVVVDRERCGTTIVIVGEYCKYLVGDPIPISPLPPPPPLKGNVGVGGIVLIVSRGGVVPCVCVFPVVEVE